MKIITLLSFLFLLPILLTSQKKVGIGHSSPQSALHIHQENQLQDPPAALQLSNGGTGSALSDGLRMYVLGPDAFLNNQEINGRLSLGTNSNSVINILNSGKIGINSDQVLGSSDLTITSLSLSSYGGMYINCLDVNGGRPFYGYAMAGNTSCWTYFDKSTDQWIVSNTGSRFFVRNSGQVGIGVSEPTQKLEVAGRIKLSTEPTIEEVGVIQYKDGDFSGYTASGEWKSLTKQKSTESMSYDDEIDFEFCNTPDTVLLNVAFGGVNSSCGVLYDSGGPSGDYSANENRTLQVYELSAKMIKIIIEELTTEDVYDKLVIQIDDTDLEFDQCIAMPDTIIISGNTLGVHFTSDGNFQRAGFKIRYEFISEAVNQAKQYSGYFYDFDKQSLAAGLNTANTWSDSLGYHAIAFGINSRASGFSSIGLGHGANATNFRSIALGESAEATGYHALAVGRKSTANHDYSSSFGQDAHTTAQQTIVIGTDFISRIGGYQNWCNLSDGRFKKDVREDIPGLEFINEL